jgi:N-acetylglucosaminyldiphosphoundecaprenol N-acetyl-beta-D-mannosaminyltransferase
MRYSIAKVRISAVTMGDALKLIEEQTIKKEPAHVCIANVRVVVLCQKDDDLCRIENVSFLTLPDGMPLVWFAKLAGVKGVERVTGVDLMTKIFALSAEKSYSHYFVGDTDITLKRMTEIIHYRYEGIDIKGTFSPPFRDLADAEVGNIAKEINRLKPSFVWVAMRAPKQEKLMARLIPRLERSILIGVGAAFRFMIGEYKHPSKFVQVCGLEGLCWRFLSNPIKEARWYCYHVPVFGCYLLIALLRRIGRPRNG